MVSQPENSASLSPRGSSSVVSRSVVSRSVLSRSRRYNRSYTGGAAYAPQNEFPVFSHSGDVEIVLEVKGHQACYLLHRHILTRCSGFFENNTSGESSEALAGPLLSELPSVAETDDGDTESGPPPIGRRGSLSSSSSQLRPRWRYRLDHGMGQEDVPILVQVPFTFTSGFAVASSATLTGDASPRAIPPVVTRSKTIDTGQAFRSVAMMNVAPTTSTVTSSSSRHPSRLSGVDRDLLRDYDNLFRIFYNYSPVLDGVDIAEAYIQCKSLLCLADRYDALSVVGPRVDHHMLQFQSRLWKQIAKYPISYLRLGYLARSKIIFQEALIHVVGQWPAGERSLRTVLPETVLDIIEDKVDDLEELVNRVEGRLLRLGLVTSRGEKVTPATSYLDWLAVSLFRQWLADNTSPEPDRRIPPDRSANHSAGVVSTSFRMASVGRAFRLVGSASLAVYLDHDDCKKFLKLTPDLYSRENLRRFEKRLDELKTMGRDIVRPLIASSLELEATSGRSVEGIAYLTCTTLSDRDLPWPVDGP